MEQWAQEIGWKQTSHHCLDRLLNAFNEAQKEKQELQTRLEHLQEQLECLYLRVNELEHSFKKAKGWGFIYLMEGDGYHKIGYSKRVPARRVQLATKLPFELKLICVIRSDNATLLEQQLHEQFADKRLCGEWFHLNESDIAYIKSLKQQQDQQDEQIDT